MGKAGAVLVVFILCVAGGSYQKPQLWPRPQSFTLGENDTFYILETSFRFVAVGESSPILSQGFNRYYSIIFPSGSTVISFPGLTELTHLDVLVTSGEEFIQFGTDESYTLSINKTVSLLTAKTVFGALRGLETFSQLVRYQMLPTTQINDFPRFPWRGLLIDTSRHYQTIDTIKTAIQGLSYDKMNVLHWHISDGQSFPYQSVVHPNLTQGAFGPEFIYSIEQISEIINYANSYGVRVMVEFDMPSHAGPSWGVGYPFLTMNCTAQLECLNPLNRFSDPCCDLPFDATNEEVYTFLKSFFEEVSSVFPDNYLHMGGDEVKTLCWEIPRILKWMKDHNISSFHGLEQYFLTRVQQFAVANNKLIVNWEEVFSSNFTLQPGTIIQVWKDQTTLLEVAKSGYGTLLSYNWYLNYLGTTWEDVYLNEPISSGFTPSEEALVYGGETCIWAEEVDETNFQPKVWPRNSAASERLWSAKDVTNIADAGFRLEFHRCRAINRGIKASPIGPGPPCSLFYI